MQDPEKVKDPVDFVQQLLTQKDKFNTIVSRSFQNDKAFQNALNQAFEHFINLNQRSPEYISLFMDDKLRKGLKVSACTRKAACVLHRLAHRMSLASL